MAGHICASAAFSPVPHRCPRHEAEVVHRHDSRHDGRATLAFGTAIGMMMTELGLVIPAAGGNVLAQWKIILTAAVPEFAGHVRAVAVDEKSGRLDVVPDAPAYATQARWCAPKLIVAANSTVPEAGIQRINVPASAVRIAATATAFPAAAGKLAPRPTTPAGPVKTKETASAGYGCVLAVYLAVAPSRQEDPTLVAAVVRQEQVRRELADRAFPDTGQEDEALLSLEDVRAQQRQAAGAVCTAAIQRALAERAGRTVWSATPALRRAG
ncbi:DUF721 domain-containing protein [Streptomyces sp. NPDC057325]|uniref:DUF721 domain-containing protein n=1 Tax=unclassified Streptomyces TaxID=2593676 RepID=UPI0036315A6C